MVSPVTVVPLRQGLRGTPLRKRSGGHYPQNTEPPQGVPWAVLGVFECFFGFSERIHCLSIIVQPLRLSSRQEYRPIHHYTEECGACYEGDYGLMQECILIHLNEHRM